VLRPRKTPPLGPAFDVTSLTAEDRWEIVTNSANFRIDGGGYVDAEDVELSALGATLSLEGVWPNAASLIFWRQETNQGRDHYVKLVHRGYMFPTGHRAVLVTIVERIFAFDPNNSELVVAYLQEITYIRIVEQSKSYPAPGQAFSGRGWPFSSVRIAARTSPHLDTPACKTFPLKLPKHTTLPFAVWGFPQANGHDVLWPLVLTDAAGNSTSLNMPLVFIEGDPDLDKSTDYAGSQYDSTMTQHIAEAYNKLSLTNATFTRLMKFEGRKVRFAVEASGHPGATTLPTIAIFLGAATQVNDPNASTTAPETQSPASLKAIDQPAFYPTISSARVRLTAVEALTRGDLNDSDDPLNLGGVGIHPYSRYVESATNVGYGATNLGLVYAALSSPPSMTFGHSDAVGGIGTPNATLTGLSAHAGAIGGPGGLDDYAKQGKIDPKTYFNSLLSQILGAIPLSSILGKFLNPQQTPVITDELDAATGTRTVTYELQAQLQDNTIDGIQFTPDPDGAGNFTMTAVTVIPTTGASTYTVQGNVDPFTVDISVFSVPFTSMSFTSASGTKPDVDTQIGNITFEGPLSFLNTLEQFLNDLGGGGFTVTVTPSGVTANFSISLPSIGVGIVNIQGLGMTAGLSIPFLGGPMLMNFGFASAENPFTVTVMIFGGGGYFLAGFGLHGVETLTVSIQFEGQLALDLGVASGGITLAAGFTFSYASSSAMPPGMTSLTAFVQLNGGITVLGILSIGLELDITLTYASIGGQSYLTGTATMIVDVPVFMFSIPVPITVKKQFAGGSNADPSIRSAERPALQAHAAPPETPSPYPAFGDVLNRTTWARYCSAFA
jgi:hypothetical protein